MSYGSISGNAFRDEAVVERLDAQISIEVAESLPRRVELPLADGGFAVEDLSLEIRFVDGVEVDETETSDARRREIQRDRAAQAADADDQRRSALELLLTFFADLGKEKVA